ncbi:MAG: hypothetical protein K0S75_2322 [Clostridia bacterium]|nr:hypothetical protein [Clostridia bacterium]
MFCTIQLKLNSNSAKHFPLFICCEKYIFENAKSDVSTDFINDKSFSQHISRVIQIIIYYLVNIIATQSNSVIKLAE